MPAIDRARVAAALPRYDLRETLGSGSFGLVFAGRHLDLDRAVAVKVMTVDDPSNGATLATTIRDEARMLSRLDHPHIVRIYEFVGQGDIFLLIMELLGGGTLSQHRLPAEAACAVGVAIADALAHAHAHNVMHRDIKPDNILFTVDGQPKLTDFGIGRVFEDVSGTTSHLVGTPRYMAPEQVTGRHLGPAVDQYSLGVVLYELLAGRPLFSSDLAVAELLRHHLEVEPSPLAEAPAPVAAAVMRALAKEPSARYPDAAAFARALSDAAAQAYGEDWLALTGLIVQNRGQTGPQTRRSGPDSSGHVFRPATARLDPSTPESARPYDTLDELTALPTPQEDPTAAVAERAGPGPAPSVPAVEQRTQTEPTHPFADFPRRGRRRPGGGRGRSQRALLAALGSVVAAAVVVTAVVVATRPAPGPGPEVVATTSAPTEDSGTVEVTLPGVFHGWAAAPGGVLYFSDQASNRVMRRDADGTVSVIAGTGDAGSTGDGGPAAKARLDGPEGLALDAQGRLYVVDGNTSSGRIRRIDRPDRPDATITTVAGSRGSGLSVNPDLPAPGTSVRFSSLSEDLAIDTNGDLYFADISTVYRLDTSGTVSMVALVGIPPTATPLPGEADPKAGVPRLLDDYLSGLAVHNGTIYASDTANNVVKSLAPGASTPRVVAGNGQEGYSGDGGPATAASLNLAVGHSATMAVDKQGNLYIADAGNLRVRRVDRQGIITTVAGNGQRSSYTDGRPAAQSALYDPERVAIADDGSLLIESSNDLARVDAQGIITTIQHL